MKRLSEVCVLFSDEVCIDSVQKRKFSLQNPFILELTVPYHTGVSNSVRADNRNIIHLPGSEDSSISCRYVYFTRTSYKTFIRSSYTVRYECLGINAIYRLHVVSRQRIQGESNIPMRRGKVGPSRACSNTFVEV